MLDKPEVKLAQGGVSGDPEVQKKWKHALIRDDPRLVTNRRGTFSFASSVPNSRTPQFIINLSDNGRMMDGRGPYGMVRRHCLTYHSIHAVLSLGTPRSSLLQCPIGEVVEGMEVLDRLQKTEPVTSDDIDQLMTLGNKWADEWNPDLSYIKTARIRETSDEAAGLGGVAAKQEL